MSDSSSDEDDDLLMMGSGLAKNRRPDRAAERKKRRQNSFLDSAILDSQRMVEEQNRISALQKKQKQSSYEELKMTCAVLTNQFEREEAQEKENQADQLDGWDISLQDAALDQARRLMLAQATRTSQSPGFGLRSIISFHLPQHSSTMTAATGIPFTFYESMADALEALSEMLQLHRPDSDNDCPALTSEYDCPALSKILLTALEDSLLLDQVFASPSSLVNKLRNAGASVLRPDLFQWLLGVVASAELMALEDRNLVYGVALNLETLVKEGFCPPSARTMTVQQLADILAHWIPNKGSSPSLAKENNHDATENNFDDLENDQNNIAGLVNVLRYLKTLITFSFWEPLACTLEEVSACLQRFCWMGLDYYTGLPRDTQCIRSYLHAVLPDFLRIVSTQIMDIDTDDDFSFLDSCVKQILDPLSTFGQGRKGTDDAEDTNAYLCYSVMLQTVPLLRDQTREPHALSCHFRAKLAMGALDRITKGQVPELATKQISCEEFSPTINKYIQICIAGFAFLDSLGLDIIEEAPLAPAVAECSTRLLDSSCLLMYLENIKSGHDSQATIARAAAFAKIVDHLDDHALQISKRTRGMCTNPHMRRLECYLNHLNQYYRYAFTKARSAAGHGERVSEQSTMDRYFKPEKTSEDVGVNSDSDSDSDSDDE